MSMFSNNFFFSLRNLCLITDLEKKKKCIWIRPVLSKHFESFMRLKRISVSRTTSYYKPLNRVLEYHARSFFQLLFYTGEVQSNGLTDRARYCQYN